MYANFEFKSLVQEAVGCFKSFANRVNIVNYFQFGELES